MDYDVESGELEMEAEGDRDEDNAEVDGLEELMDPDPDGVRPYTAIKYLRKGA